MHRFFIPPEDIHSDVILFHNQCARQIARVLRLKTGDACVVLDNLGYEFLVSLEHISPEECSGRIIEKRTAVEPGVSLLMLLCLAQREKFEWMLQKCTEVGAAGFLPVISQRSLVQDKSDVLNKHERWHTILKEAAEQSGRGRIPELFPPLSLPEAVQDVVDEFPLRLIPWEGEKRMGIKTLLAGHRIDRVAVLIGPEGGFSSQEVQSAQSAGFQTVTLGKRILRMETAAVVSAALILHELE